MKSIFRFSLLLVALLGLLSCGEKDNPGGGEDTKKENQAASVMASLWQTSPLSVSSQRTTALNTIQNYADKCSATYFSGYLASLDKAAETSEKYDDMLYCYRAALDRVVEQVKSTSVEEGSVAIWLLYNMGYIIKTPSGCFGIDICHRWGQLLAPYLDFLCITHKHSDHYTDRMTQAMLDLNKPVISNFVNKGTGYTYTSSYSESYTIGKFVIHTNLTDHNTTLTNFVTTFQINCGEDTGNMVLMHVGDSNYQPSQYTIYEPVDIFIPRYAPNALTENNIIGSIVTPKYVLLSHILELAHDGEENSRWSFSSAFDRASKLNCANTYVPMWGEKLIWKNGLLR